MQKVHNYPKNDSSTLLLLQRRSMEGIHLRNSTSKVKSVTTSSLHSTFYSESTPTWYWHFPSLLSRWTRPLDDHVSYTGLLRTIFEPTPKFKDSEPFPRQPPDWIATSSIERTGSTRPFPNPNNNCCDYVTNDDSNYCWRLLLRRADNA